MTDSSPYQGYAYSYPHKMAYRPLDPPVALDELWAGEERDALFLYLHIPFCEMRCGFCNLFTTANPEQEMTQAYLKALERQSRQVSAALGEEARFARMAIGGGTPTYLDARGLETLFDLTEKLFAVAPGSVPVSVETSPRTAESDRLRVLRERGVTRISMGVQSFIEAEVTGLGRAQKNTEVQQAIDRIRTLGFPTLNLDLIYGAAGQTVESWLASLHEALRFSPEELYLYPLYVRPLTGLGRRGSEPGDLRLECYRVARNLLTANGYEQISMRMFRRADAAEAGSGPVYCCQDDGMAGLGCGARSYTSTLHYSTEYAVGAGGVRAILGEYLRASDADFAHADYGVQLDEEDRRRRWMVKSLLRNEGLDRAAYRARFRSDPEDDLPELAGLEAEGLLVRTGTGLLQLTPAGMEQSDAIGPRFYSDRVRELMADFALR